MKITGLAGVMGSGKDYRAKELFERHARSKIIAFADVLVSELTQHLRSLAPSMDSKLHPSYEPFKFMTFSMDAVPPTTDTNGQLVKWPKPIMTGRELLIWWGTDYRRRMFDSSYWILKWLEKAIPFLNNRHHIIVPDVRFSNEIDAIFALNGTIIFCNYQSSRYNPSYNSPSEKMAQNILAVGGLDGDVLTPEFLHSLERVT